jgi:C-terminal processing protease CtpA/Prc
VRIPIEAFVRADGSLIDRHGITPDVLVEWTQADVRTGRDPDMEAALKAATK